MNTARQVDTDKQALILFDGVCRFCNASVRMVINNDPHLRFRFCPLQSALGQSLLKVHKVDSADLDSMILIQNKKAYIKSTAALKIAGQMRMPWPLLSVFLLVPPFIRHRVYDLIGRNRYRWFGKLSQCMVPDPSLRQRFLE